MKRTAKQIGSLFLTVCMVFILLPTVAFAETGITDSGALRRASGTMNIGGETGKDLSVNQIGAGWAWDAATATLTLDSSYVSSNAIFISCATTDTINLEYIDNVNISVADIAFNCKGALNIDGSGTLTLENTTTSNCALQVINGDLNISGGTLVATGPIGIYSNSGDTIIGGSADVTAVSTGINSFSSNTGIMANTGCDISITGGTVNATGKGAGQYDGALIADNITITGGDVSLFADIPSNYAIADGGVLTISGPATVKIGGTPVYLATLTLSGVNTQTAVSAVTSPTSDYGIASMTTGADGKLYFLLPEGNQTVTLTADGTTYSGTVTVTTDHAATATLAPQGTPTPTTASISGTIKGNDTNSGMSGATVRLKDTGGGLLATTTTDASGQYSFDELAVGTYRIEASAVGYRSGTLSGIVLETANISGKDITLTKIGGGGGGDSDSGGGGSSGGSTPPATVTSPNVDSAGAVNQTAITGEAAAALSGAAPGGTAVVRTQNASSITPAVLGALANAAAGRNIVLHADTMSGNAVQGRVYIDPAKLADVKEPIKLGVYTESAKTAATKSLFEKYFGNKVATVSFEQQGSLGARLEIAAKVDLTGMDVTKLVLYSYDKATNTYRRIENPAHWVDKNGYLHFTTQFAGDIIIGEGPLSPISAAGND